MADKLLVSGEAFEAAKTQFNNLMNEMGNTYKDVYITVDRLEDTWKGEASTAFRSQFGDMYKNVEQTGDAMQSIITRLEKAWNLFQENEQKEKEMLGKLDVGTKYTGKF